TRCKSSDKTMRSFDRLDALRGFDIALQHKIDVFAWLNDRESTDDRSLERDTCYLSAGSYTSGERPHSPGASESTLFLGRSLPLTETALSMATRSMGALVVV